MSVDSSSLLFRFRDLKDFLLLDAAFLHDCTTRIKSKKDTTAPTPISMYLVFISLSARGFSVTYISDSFVLQTAVILFPAFEFEINFVSTKDEAIALQES